MLFHLPCLFHPITFFISFLNAWKNQRPNSSHAIIITYHRLQEWVIEYWIDSKIWKNTEQHVWKASAIKHIL
jgi:hypothetical protein